MSDYQETLYQGYGQRFSIDNMLHEVRTEHQHLVIFENARMGRVMALDGVIQTTEADEFIYHEMLTHVPILAHGAARRVLIIGGGDGGMLREVAKHKSVERITMVEIDGTVVDMCKAFLPNHSQGAFDDPRLNLVIDDGMRFVATTEERFDVIISDSTDPIGPGEVLFSENFYQACRRCLNEVASWSPRTARRSCNWRKCAPPPHVPTGCSPTGISTRRRCRPISAAP